LINPVVRKTVIRRIQHTWQAASGASSLVILVIGPTNKDIVLQSGLVYWLTNWLAKPNLAGKEQLPDKQDANHSCSCHRHIFLGRRRAGKPNKSTSLATDGIDT